MNFDVDAPSSPSPYLTVLGIDPVSICRTRLLPEAISLEDGHLVVGDTAHPIARIDELRIELRDNSFIGDVFLVDKSDIDAPAFTHLGNAAMHDPVLGHLVGVIQDHGIPVAGRYALATTAFDLSSPSL